MIFLPWVLACSAPRPTLVPGVWDSGGALYWASDWETAPCPTWAPYDQDGRTWTYGGRSGDHEVTLRADGAETYLDRQVIRVTEYASDVDWGGTSVYWACEADGLHLAGVSETS